MELFPSSESETGKDLVCLVPLERASLNHGPEATSL
jgi:hypothetical protein